MKDPRAGAAGLMVLLLLAGCGAAVWWMVNRL